MSQIICKMYRYMSLLLTSWRAFSVVYFFMGLRLIALGMVISGLIYIAGSANRVK
jgi:hypothetical protein